jgi:hypothetical protein
MAAGTESSTPMRKARNALLGTARQPGTVNLARRYRGGASATDRVSSLGVAQPHGLDLRQCG